jgi:DNA transformation protein
MKVKPSFVSYIESDLLCDIPNISSRNMFGGWALFSHSLCFAVIDEDTLYFKVNEITKKKYEGKNCWAFEYSPGKFLKSYYKVPIDVFEDRETLVAWANEAIGVARKK